MTFEEFFAPRTHQLCYAEWVWCLHCAQAHPRQAWEVRYLNCPTPHCDGGIGDAFTWDYVRTDKPDYPRVPEEGVYYPM